MDKIRSIRIEGALPAALLMLAVSICLSAWLVAIGTIPSFRCPFGSCVLRWFSSGLFWHSLLLALMGAATVLLAVTPNPRPRKHGLAARFWLVYLLLGLAALEIGWGFLTYWANPRLLIAQQLPLELISAAAPTLQLYRLFTSVLPFPDVVITLIVWQLVSRSCSTKPEQHSKRSRGRHALLFYLVFATLLAALLSALNFYLVQAGGLDYSRMVDQYEDLTHVSFELMPMIIGLIMALPAWVIAYWRNAGGRGSLGTVLAAVAAVLTSLAIFVASLIESVVFIEDSAGVLALSVVLLLWWLVLNALAAWFVCWAIRPLQNGRDTASPYNLGRLAAASACAVVVFCILGIFGIIVTGEMGGRSGSPLPRTLVAQDLLSEQEAGYQNSDSCAGVVRAGGTLWLVGMDDYGLFSSFHKVPEKTSAYNFVAHLPKPDGLTDYTVASAQVTVLSRLTDDHHFKAVTYLPGWACLHTAPGTHKLVLQTELSRWNGANLTVDDDGLFTSSDGGRSWAWVEPGTASGLNSGTEIPAFEGGDIKRLEYTRSGSTYAIIRRSGGNGTIIARAPAGSEHWTNLGALPNPFWFLGQARADGFWASDGVLVVEVDVTYVPPQFEGVESWDTVDFDAEGTYYSIDQGRHWHQLGISDYPGVLGVDPVTDRIYFGGNGDSVMALDVTPEAAKGRG